VATGKIASMSADLFYPDFDLSWSPDGTRLIATNDYGNSLRRWRVDTDQWVRLWDARIQPAMQAKWSPDGTQIASGDLTGNVMVWNTQNNQCEGLIRAHSNSVDALDWLPSGGQFASASGAIRTWDSHTGEMLSAFGYHDGIRYQQLRWFEPQTIATLETAYTQDLPATIRFWDISTGGVKLAFRGWDDAITDIGYVALRLDDVKVFEDRTEMRVSLLFDLSGEISLAGDWTILATDSQGKTYPLTNITPATMDSDVTRVYQTTPLPEGELIRLELKSTQPVQGLPMAQNTPLYPEQRAEFLFDPAKLQIGEAVKLNQEFENWIQFQLTGAQKNAANELTFEFNAQNSPDRLVGLDLSAPNVTGSSFKTLDKNKFAVTVIFSKIPTQPVQVQITKIYYVVKAIWAFDFHVVKSMFAE
jgi:WD40 repeat protein